MSDIKKSLQMVGRWLLILAVVLFKIVLVIGIVLLFIVKHAET